MTKKPKRKVINIRIDFINVDIKVITNCDIVYERNAIRKEYPMFKLFTDPDIGGLHTCLYNSYPGKHWIFLPPNCLISSLNHEIQHAIDRICTYFGFKDTEFRAYLFEYISHKVIGYRSV